MFKINPVHISETERERFDLLLVLPDGGSGAGEGGSEGWVPDEGNGETKGPANKSKSIKQTETDLKSSFDADLL